MKNIATITLIILISLLTGCASHQTASPEQFATMMKALQSRGGSSEKATTPVLNLHHPIISIVIENDTIGLQQALTEKYDALGITVVHDPSLVGSGAVIAGEVTYVGDPNKAPQHDQLNTIGRSTKLAGGAAMLSRFAMGSGSAMSLVTSGIGLATSAVSKAMAPKKKNGQVTLRVKQNGHLWDISISQTVEAPSRELDSKLAEALTKEALHRLQG